MKGIIVSSDVKTLPALAHLIDATHNSPAISGYKIGFSLGLRFGLPATVREIRRQTDKPIIYDHQKAGTDIPDTGKDFAELCKEAGINTIILFPHTGPETLENWVNEARKQNLGVIVGGDMTHKKYVSSEGGYISDEAIIRIYADAANLGIRDFVVPGTKPETLHQLSRIWNTQEITPTLYAPGFIAQGGKLGAFTEHQNLHPIIGRGIYDPNKDGKATKQDIEQAVQKIAKEIGM